MKKAIELFRLFTQLFLACAVDLADGVFIAVILSRHYGFEVSLSLFAVAAMAMVMTVSPDFDFAVNRHDESHKPLPFVGTLLVLTWATWSTSFGFWFLLWAICATVHFVHDSVGDDNSGGVAWLWPFNKLFITFLLSNHLLKSRQNDRAEVLLICPHTREELTPPIGTLGWLKFYYGRVTVSFVFSLLYLEAAVFFLIAQF